MYQINIPCSCLPVIKETQRNSTPLKRDSIIEGTNVTPYSPYPPMNRNDSYPPSPSNPSE